MDAGIRTFSPSELNELVEHTFVNSVEYLPAHPSTNDRALEIARGETGPLPQLVIVDEQTAGRGRSANRWWSSRGALTFSLLVDTVALRLEPAKWPRVSLATGLAVCNAVDHLLGDEHRVGLKWPNDVLAGRRKLSGILVEVPPHRKDLLVVGIGVNVNGQAAVPDELQASVVSLSDLAGHEQSLVRVLATILTQLEEKLGWLADDNHLLHQRWQQRCVLTGRTVRLKQHDQSITGLCRGIDHDGALLLDTPEQPMRCLSGTVEEWG